MSDSAADVLDLFDGVWERLRNRMAGLRMPSCVGGQHTTGATLGWRLQHIAQTLTEARNWDWLGIARDDAAPASSPVEPHSAEDALMQIDEAFGQWRGLLAPLTEQWLDEPIGPAAGPYGAATRRSFVLHIADELIHHGAEAALLRDLFAAGVTPASNAG